ncbi:synaptogenesis protein syg-2-like isoform X2 [Plodia interpunctella]|uniref:synaptogenesis protein syg-2-like isoform X2 n=1 Tax=Plodia interpunctella TaxID=58824 RepID=UPI002367C808|nr:synaptogenesis protein syg-2-like isoform X2 [Plodia interpunctella]
MRVSVILDQSRYVLLGNTFQIIELRYLFSINDFVQSAVKMKYLIFNAVFIVVFYSTCAQNVYEQVEAVLERTAELTCNVTAETENDKLKILAWYKDGSSAAFYSRDLRVGNGTVSSADRRYRLVSSEAGQATLQILETRASDAGRYMCHADFASSPAIKTFLELTVIEPPQQLWVIYENGSRVATSRAGANTSRNIGPYYVGDTIHLYCVAFKGQPQPTVFWWSKKRLLKIKDSSIPLSDLRVRSDLTYGPLEREDHGHVLSCLANNNNHTTPLYIDVVIDMLLPPVLVTLHDPRGKAFNGGRAIAGEILALQCRVLDARPSPAISWKLDQDVLQLDQNFTMDTGQRLTVSDVQLKVRREHDEARVTCCATAYNHGGDRSLCAKPLPLLVTYKPVLKIVVTEELEDNVLFAAKGATVILTCVVDANPAAYSITWFHGENEVYRENNLPLKGKFILENVTVADAGEYACAADNDMGYDYSEPIVVNVTYTPYCRNEARVQYGSREDESVNITCDVDSNPPPVSYRWVVVKDDVNASTLRNHSHITIDTEDPVLEYQRPNDTVISTIFCWGMNNISSNGQPHTPCVSLVTAETPPWPPADCGARKNTVDVIDIHCEMGHDGGSPQTFLCIVKSTITPDEIFTSITRSEPTFVVNEPSQEEYEIIIIASNAKGNSTSVAISKSEITVSKLLPSAVEDITTLTLALCGGVALVALAACGLVLCARERAERADLPRVREDPPLCAYNTEESNCETCHDSDESECNVRRTESFRRAMAKYPSSKNFDVRRTSSFHSARYMNEMAAEQEATSKFNEGLQHSASCRMHSLQNISRKRDMDALCDHLVMHLPPETNYPAPKPMNTFYTMPRKMRNKLAKELSDETSEITQASDQFSLPPPPDEYGSYRAGTRIRDMPTKSNPPYTTIVRKNVAKDEQKQQCSNVIISPMNTVGLPTISGQTSVYSYPDDHNHHALQTAPATLTTFQSYSSPKESGL